MVMGLDVGDGECWVWAWSGDRVGQSGGGWVSSPPAVLRAVWDHRVVPHALSTCIPQLIEDGSREGVVVLVSAGSLVKWWSGLW